MIIYSDDTKKKVEELAIKLHTIIPSDIDLIFWALPLLQKLVEKVEELEKEGDTKSIKNDGKRR